MPNQLSTLMTVLRQTARGQGHFSTDQFFKDAGDVKAWVSSFLADVETASRDDSFTPKGLGRRRVEIGKPLRAKVLAWRDKNVAGLEAHRAAERASMVRATSKPTDVAERVELALRQSEIRASLRGLDPLEVEMIYRTADPETRVAMESSPPTIRRARPDVLPTAAPLVRPELVAELAEARLAEQNPEAAARIAELSEIAALYASVAEAAVRLIEDTAPGTKPETQIPTKTC